MLFQVLHTPVTSSGLSRLQYLQVSSMSQHVSEFPSFSRLRNIPRCGYRTSSTSTGLQVDIWVISTLSTTRLEHGCAIICWSPCIQISGEECSAEENTGSYRSSMVYHFCRIIILFVMAAGPFSLPKHVFCGLPDP